MVGIMGVAWLVAQNAGLPEARYQPIDQVSDGICILRRRFVVSVELQLGRAERLCLGDAQAERVEAEAGIERIGDGIEALAVKPDNRAGVAGWPAGFNAQPPHHAIAAEKARIEHTPTLPPLGQDAACLSDQFGEQTFDGRRLSHRFGEMPFDGHGGQRPERGDPRVLEALCAGEAGDEVLAEPGSKNLRRALRQIADGLEARPRQGDHRFLGQSGQRCDRQLLHQGCVLSGGRDGDAAETGECCRRIGCAGDAGANFETDLREARCGLCPQSRLAAEEVRASGDVEQQSIGRGERDQRREPSAHHRQLIEELGIGASIGLGDGEIGDPRPRIREAHPRCQAELDRLLIDSDNPERAFDFRNDDKRRLSVRGGRCRWPYRGPGCGLPRGPLRWPLCGTGGDRDPPHPVGGEKRKPQREIAARRWASVVLGCFLVGHVAVGKTAGHDSTPQTTIAPRRRRAGGSTANQMLENPAHEPRAAARAGDAPPSGSPLHLVPAKRQRAASGSEPPTWPTPATIDGWL